MVYDVGSRKSFEEIDTFWLNEVETYADPDVKIVLIGNKIDLPETERKVPKEEAELYAKRHKILYFETSAKESNNIEETFTEISKHALDL